MIIVDKVFFMKFNKVLKIFEIMTRIISTKLSRFIFNPGSISENQPEGSTKPSTLPEDMVSFV